MRTIAVVVYRLPAPTWETSRNSPVSIRRSNSRRTWAYVVSPMPRASAVPVRHFGCNVTIFRQSSCGFRDRRGRFLILRSRLVHAVFFLLSVRLFLPLAVQRLRGNCVFGALWQRRKFEPHCRKVNVDEVSPKHIGPDQPVFIGHRAFVAYEDHTVLKL